MNKFVSILIVFVLMLVMFKGSFAQDRVMPGRIYVFDSIPVVNASVKIKSTKQVVYSDTLGNFYAPCNYDDVLKISAKGFITEKVKVDSKIKLVLANLALKMGEKNREYAIGYGHVTDADRLNSMANLNSDDLDFSQYTNMFELIRGRFASVQVVNDEIIIRGKNSLMGSNAALIVLDGMPVSSSVLNTLPPNEVKSINIIKDSGSAIYGSRGANGVVLIETRRGSDN